MNENNPVFDDLKKRYGKVVYKAIRPSFIIEAMFIGLVIGMLSFYAGLDIAHNECGKHKSTKGGR